MRERLCIIRQGFWIRIEIRFRMRFMNCLGRVRYHFSFFCFTRKMAKFLKSLGSLQNYSSQRLVNPVVEQNRQLALNSRFDYSFNALILNPTQGQLTSLVTTLGSCTPHYVRCIKPNLEKVANKFDDDLVMGMKRKAPDYSQNSLKLN